MLAISLLSLTCLAAFGCAMLMGYAIQRGATCMVFAMREVVSRRRVSRLVAMLEASCWVAGGLLLASVAGGLAMQPGSYALTAVTLGGGALLGIGALINGACVFGAVARLGSGDWAYALTPLGFYLGCLSIRPALPTIRPVLVSNLSHLFEQHWLLLPFLAFALLRGREALSAARSGRLARHVWSPHHATTVIGLTFIAMFLMVGAWAYTETLAALAQGMASDLRLPLILFAALLAGTLLGGWTAKSWRLEWPTSRAMARCMIGGVLMGWGSQLVPGGNDGLILIGLPFLQPYAWGAVFSMTAAIVAGLLIEQRFAPVATATSMRYDQHAS